MSKMEELKDINEELDQWVAPLKDYLNNNKIKPTETQKNLFKDVDEFLTQFSEQDKKSEKEPDEMELSPIYRTLKKISESLKLIFDDMDGRTQGKKHLGNAPERLINNLDRVFDVMNRSLRELSPEMQQEINKPKASAPKKKETVVTEKPKVKENAKKVSPEVKPVDKTKPSVEAFEDMLKQINDADPMYIRSSKDFRAAKDAIKNVIKLSNSAPKSFDKDGSIKNMEINNKICDALDYAQLYVRNKKNEPNLSDLAKKRIATMEKVVEQLGEQYGLSNKQCNRKDRTNGEVAQEFEEQAQDLIKAGRDLTKNEAAEVAAKHKYAQFLKKEGVDGHYNEIMAMRGMNSLIKKINDATKQKEKTAEPELKLKDYEGPTMNR